jgi:hypothetical protein
MQMRFFSGIILIMILAMLFSHAGTQAQDSRLRREVEPTTPDSRSRRGVPLSDTDKRGSLPGLSKEAAEVFNNEELTTINAPPGSMKAEAAEEHSLQKRRDHLNVQVDGIQRLLIHYIRLLSAIFAVLVLLSLLWIGRSLSRIAREVGSRISS